MLKMLHELVLVLTKEICEDFFRCGVNVITTGNHVWDQKEYNEFYR